MVRSRSIIATPPGATIKEQLKLICQRNMSANSLMEVQLTPEGGC